MIDMFTDHNRSIQKYYEERAKDYDKQKRRTWSSAQGFSSRIIENVLKSLSKVHEGPILEVGVGSGRIALPILERSNLKLGGLDISRDMLSLANRKLSKYPDNYSMILGNGMYLPIKGRVLGGLICISVFHYFHSPNKVLSEFSRLLRDEGVYVYGDLTLHEQDTSAFIDRLELSISHAHARYFTPSEMKSMIEESGIRVVQIETIPYQKTYKALIQDKAQYFGVNPSTLHEIVNNATNQEKELYELEKEQMTLYYTLMMGTKK